MPTSTDTFTTTASARQLRARAKSLRVLASLSLEPLAVAYRRRAAELELIAAVKGGQAQFAYIDGSVSRTAA